MYNQKNHQFESFYNHKFGFHISGPRQDAFNEVLRLKPKVVKTLDFSVDVMKRFKQEIPDLFLIGRLFVHPQDFGQLSGSTAQIARQKGIDMAERILREEVNQDRHHFNGKPLFDGWESLNEVFPEWTDENTQKLFEEYQVAFGQTMLKNGFEPIAFNFGQGNGRGRQWLDLYPGTLETYTYLGFHEYDWPTMNRLHNLGLNGPVEPHNRVPVVGEGRGNDGMWRCLRYRRIMNEGIRQRFGDKHTVIITECGMTQGVWGGPSLDIGPWAHEVTVPSDIPGGVAASPIPVDDYWQSLLWYNSELMRDDYVMGACLFVTGAAGKPEWETFEHLGPIMERLTTFQQPVAIDQLPTVVPNPTPSVVPENFDSRDNPETRQNKEEENSMTIEETYIQEEEQEQTAAPEPEYRLKTGPGMGLLVGDIGKAGEYITITRPNGRREWQRSGGKPEHGPGGFEVYAQQAGVYVVEFMERRFELPLTGQFTHVTFLPPRPDAPPPKPKETPAAAPAKKTQPEATSKPKPTSSSPKPAAKPQPKPATPVPTTGSSSGGWNYSLESGRGLPLLIGDIGVPNETITIVKPGGWQDRVTSGSKPEYGPGGFETYAHKPGVYKIRFLDQTFEIELKGLYTKITFDK